MAMLALAIFLTSPASADIFHFSTGDVTNAIATASGPHSLPSGTVEIETADDFVLTQATSINHATITGLLPVGSPLTNIIDVEIEVYHVFPSDSNIARTSGPPTFSTVNVPTRVNSPGDVEIASATRVGIAGSLSFTASALNSNFAVANTVVNGIHPIPNQTTGGEGPATGKEVLIDVTFNTPIVLPADHYFFRPEVQLTNGDFLWLSGSRPIGASGTPFPPGFTDLQSWIRNSDLKPDWLRIGTDIVGPPLTGGAAPTFNAAFSLDGTTVPEPSTLLLLGSGLAGLAGLAAWRRKKAA